MTRMLKDLSKEELKKVFELNEKLRQDVSEDFEESEMHWIGEYIDGFRECLNNWEIGFYNHNHLHFKNEDIEDFRKFIDCLEGVQKDYCFLKDEFNPKIEEVKEMIEKVEEMERELDDVDEENYSECEKIIEDLKEEVEEKVKYFQHEVLKQFNEHTDYSSDTIEEYFLTFYVDERMDETFYVNEDYELFKDIAYTKSYKK